jgi:hypothetical protein
MVHFAKVVSIHTLTTAMRADFNMLENMVGCH